MHPDELAALAALRGCIVDRNATGWFVGKRPPPGSRIVRGHILLLGDIAPLTYADVAQQMEVLAD